MKLKLAFAALVAFGGAALSAGTASAMPLAPLQSNASNVESVALVCGPRGCVRTVPAYRRGVVVVRRPYVRRYGYHRGYRRY
jgi:type IV secretory pathway protease TraF